MGCGRIVWFGPAVLQSGERHDLPAHAYPVAIDDKKPPLTFVYSYRQFQVNCWLAKTASRKKEKTTQTLFC